MSLTIVAIGFCVLLAVNVVIVLGILSRRVATDRRARHEQQLQRRFSPVVSQIMKHGELPLEGSPLDRMTADGAMVIAGMLAQYGRALRGDARRRITDFFAVSGLLAQAHAELCVRPAWRRMRALDVIGDIGAEASLAAIVSQLDSRSAEVRHAAVRALGRLGLPACAVPLSELLLGDRPMRGIPRASVFHALAELGEVGSVAFLKALASADPQVRMLACHGLALTQPEVGYVIDIAPALARRLEVDEDPGVRAAAADSIGALIDARVTAALVRSLTGDGSALVRRAAARALGAVADPAGIDALVEAMGDADREVAIRAAEAVALLADGAETRDAAFAAITPASRNWALDRALLQRSVAIS